jgi:DNA polymerase elongation subunit (family B)
MDYIRSLIVTENDRLELDESKIDIFKQSNLEIKPYQLTNQIKPYNQIKRLYLDIETTGLDKTTDRIIAIGFRYRLDDIDETTIFTDKDESLILKQAITYINTINPDILFTYNGFNFDLPFIIYRCDKYGIKHRFVINNKEKTVSKAVVKAKPITYYGVFDKTNKISLIDTFHFLVQWDNVERKVNQIGSGTYGLKKVLLDLGLRKEKRLELSANQIFTLWEQGDTNPINEYLTYDVEDTAILSDYIFPPIYEQKAILTTLTIQDIAYKGTGGKWEYIFEEKLYPNYPKPVADSKKSYGGGYTCAYHGLYQCIGKIDVKSMYPNIMLHYGITSRKDKDNKMLSILKFFYDERIRLKEIAETTGDLVAKQKQGSYKIFINSAYGALGTEGLPYNDYYGASGVTAIGRAIVKHIIKCIEDSGGVIIEVDTDGVYYKGDSTVHLRQIHQYAQSQMPNGIELDYEIEADAIYIPKDKKTGNSIIKNYIIYNNKLKKGKDTIKGTKFNNSTYCELQKQFWYHYIKHYLESYEDAEGYYKLWVDDIIPNNNFSNYSQICQGKDWLYWLSTTYRLSKNQTKKAQALGKEIGDVVTTFIGQYGETTNTNQPYDTSHYIKMVDEIRDEIVQHIAPSKNTTGQLDLLSLMM